jgi:hypothetical protein
MQLSFPQLLDGQDQEGEKMTRKTGAEDGLVADLFHDGSGQPRKAIILIGGSEGGEVWSSIGTRKVVSQLTSQGYILLSLAYFKSPGLPGILREGFRLVGESARGYLR